MAFVYYNPNPKKNLVGDCVIRAISKLTNRSWEDVYLDVAMVGLEMKNMPSANDVWSTYLYNIGFDRVMIPNTCPNCYTIKDFCLDNPEGTYLLATGTHVVTVQDGNYYDTWDSGDEVPMSYWKRSE